MTNNTDPVRALIAKWRLRALSAGAIEGAMIRAYADELEAALASAPPSAPVGVDDALVAGAMEAAADACSRHVVCNEAITAALEYALSQQPAAPSGEAVAEVVEFYGLRAVSWIGTGAAPGLPVGTKLYAAPQQPAGVDGMVMVQASDLKTLAEFADRGMRGNPAKLAALRAKAILAANRQEVSRG